MHKTRIQITTTPPPTTTITINGHRQKKLRNDFSVNLAYSNNYNNESRLVTFNNYNNNNNQKPYFPKSKPQLIRQKNKNPKANRHRLININVNKLKAPYNTTQYLMYDYSKRRGPLKDQQCPDEQEQFTNDWNLALNQGMDEGDPSLVLLKNFFSLNKNDTVGDDNNDNDDEEDDDDDEETGVHREQDSQMRLLKKSLSELDLTSENDLSNFLSTSI